MKYLDEYRDAEGVRRLAAAIHKAAAHPWTLMEICGGQTHAIVKYGLDSLLPPTIELVHGPGCPVCVTPVEILDQAMELASRPDVIFCTFGDMMRVPGSRRDLLTVKAAGGGVRMVYSPLDALTIAAGQPGKQVVFFAVGFETTAPANAMAVFEAKKRNLANFSILCAQVRVPPAMEAILSSPDNRVRGFLAAGHVCTIMGCSEYEPIAQKYQTPIVVTGFEPLDILQGIHRCVLQLEAGTANVENAYARVVRPEGNPVARDMMFRIFCPVDRAWRGIGTIPQSGLGLRPEYSDFDASLRFDLQKIQTREAPECIAGQILQGLKKPRECPAFGTLCAPDHPLGAPMVSSEGACAAYFRYRPHET